MAANLNAAPAGPANDSWKAQGFLNYSLPRLDDDGKVVGLRKVGSIPLKTSDPFQAALIKRITRGAEGRTPEQVEADIKTAVAEMMAVMVVDYRSAEPKNVDPKAIGF